MSYSNEGLKTFLDSITLPVLSDADREALDKPFTLEEMQTVAMGVLNNKALGAGDLPGEVYKTYGKALLPLLQSLYLHSSLRRSSLYCLNLVNSRRSRILLSDLFTNIGC